MIFILHLHRIIERSMWVCRYKIIKPEIEELIEGKYLQNCIGSVFLKGILIKEGVK